MWKQNEKEEKKKLNYDVELTNMLATRAEEEMKKIGKWVGGT